MPPEQSPRILVIDDSSTIRKMIISALRPLRAAFYEAGSGLEALEQLALQSYALILLDLNMPDMHGMEFLQFIRGHVRFKDIPVVVITSRIDAQQRQETLAAGANRYLTKPFQPEDILTVTRELLGHV